jgi:transketolase
LRNLSFVPKSEFDRLLIEDISSIEKTKVFAAFCRINILYMIAKGGSGHIGTSLSCVDVVSWLFLNKLGLPGSLNEKEVPDIYFSSKGHDAPALYAIMTALGILEFDLIHEFRRLGGLPGHPDVGTKGIPTNTGSLGMGISKAKGFVSADRLSGLDREIFVLTGDGELQEGQIWESLGSAANESMANIYAIVDNNKIQSDTWVKDTSDTGDLVAKFSAFGWYAASCDGNDVSAFAEALDTAGSTNKPKVIIADTIKGRGVGFMEGQDLGEDGLYEFHSGAPSEADYSRANAQLIEDANSLCTKFGIGPLQNDETTIVPTRPNSNALSLIGRYEKELVVQGNKNPNVVALDADLRVDVGSNPFSKSFPERYFECGIAEQDMVSRAGTLSLSGYVPVLHSFACFMVPRANEQIYNNATEHSKIVYIGALAGILPAGPGHSHQSVRDIAALRGTPGLNLVEPGCGDELAAILDWAINISQESTYIRLVSIPWELDWVPEPDAQLQIGKGTVIAGGTDVTITAYGPILLSQALEARSMLRDLHGISARVINLPWLDKVDSDWLGDAIASDKPLVTLDNHYINGGQGMTISAAMATLETSTVVTNIGITEIPECGTNKEVLHAHGLDAESLAGKIYQTLNAGDKL